LLFSKWFDGAGPSYAKASEDRGRRVRDRQSINDKYNLTK